MKLIDKHLTNNSFDKSLTANNIDIPINDTNYITNEVKDINEDLNSIGTSKLNSNSISDSTNKPKQLFQVGIVLFKIHDLRIRDHEAIMEANINCQQVLYLFVTEDY